MTYFKSALTWTAVRPKRFRPLTSAPADRHLCTSAAFPFAAAVVRSSCRVMIVPKPAAARTSAARRCLCEESDGASFEPETDSPPPGLVRLPKSNSDSLVLGGVRLDGRPRPRLPERGEQPLLVPQTLGLCLDLFELNGWCIASLCSGASAPTAEAPLRRRS